MAETWSLGEMAPSSSSSLTESMRRFSMTRRKSSYTSSNDGSSATQDSVSTGNSSRSSVPADRRRRSNRTSFSAMLKKGSSRIVEENELALQSSITRTSTSGSTFGALFLDLPAEIQTDVLTFLSVGDLLALRITSRATLAIFQANAPTIARNLFYSSPFRVGSDSTAQDGMYNKSFIDLYPSTFSSTTTDAYFLRSLRREALNRRQMRVLLTYIQTRVYMLRLTRDLECEHFSPYRNGLERRLSPILALVQHYFEVVRHLILFSHPEHKTNGIVSIDACASCATIIQSTISGSYPKHELVAMYHCIQLLMHHLRAAVRSPSSVTIFERKLKGWDYGPPPEDHMAQLVLLGGIKELSKIDEMQGSYGKRLYIVKSFMDRITEAVKINSIAFPDVYQSGPDPVMAMAGSFGTMKPKKSKTSESRRSSRTADLDYRSRAANTAAVGMDRNYAQRDKSAPVLSAIEACASEVPVLKSLDVRFDLLTPSVIGSVPLPAIFLEGLNTRLAQYILKMKLVSARSELENPYDWLVQQMDEVYKAEKAGTNEEDGGMGVGANATGSTGGEGQFLPFSL